MHHPIAVRQSRLKDLLKELRWDQDDLCDLITKRREQLEIGDLLAPKSKDGIKEVLNQVRLGRALLPISLATEIETYLSRPNAELYGQAQNGEALVHNETKQLLKIAIDAHPEAMKPSDDAPVNDTPPGDEMSKHIRDLRSEALKKAMDDTGKGPAALAKMTFPRQKKMRLKRRQALQSWRAGVTILPDNEIPWLATVLGVDEATLKVRDLSDEESQSMERGLRGVETRMAKKSRKPNAVGKKEETKSSPKSSVTKPVKPAPQSNDNPKLMSLTVDQTDLANSILTAKNLSVWAVTDDKKVRVEFPLTAEFLALAFGIKS